MSPSLGQTYTISNTSKYIPSDDRNRAPSYDVGSERVSLKKGVVSMMVVVDGDLRDPSHH